jgi:hypothetical protein
MAASSGSVSPKSPTHFENTEQTTNTTSASLRPQEQLPSTGPSFQQQQIASSRSMTARIREREDIRKREHFLTTSESSEELGSPHASQSSFKRVRQELESIETDSGAAMPVIRELEPEEARAALEAFKQSVEQWGSSFGANADMSDSGRQVAQTSTAGANEKWATRLEQTNDIIAEIDETDCEGSTVYACQANGQTIGMVLLDDLAIPCISRIATHPESKGVGSALIEQAVNTSQQWDKQGCLEADASNVDSLQAFLALGFIHTGGGALTLDPASSDKWSRNESDQWQLSKRRETKYPVNFGE